MDYTLRIKNVQVLEIKKNCSLPASLATNFAGSNNSFIGKGLGLGNGDY